MTITNDQRRTRITTAALGPSSVLTRVDTSAVKLVVGNTVSKGRSVSLSKGTVTIGAGDECDLKIDDPTVSRAHAKVSRLDGGALVVDLDSTNGTFYEKSRVKEVVVPFGSTILLGKAQLKVLPEETEVKAEPATFAAFGGLVGEDRRMREMFSLLADVAPTDATVVIEGETGTGKELVARALHDNSSRAKGPFVVFDCSAVPRDLVESSLFGHVKGAFTGATATRQGAFRRAHGGTVFLDEIGELPLDLQPKLLRAIESRTVQMVGGDEYERVDVRVVAATNRNLKSEVRGGRFREDLYYRLAVVRIVMPALRERLDDLDVLVKHFVRIVEKDSGRPNATIDPGAFPKLREYRWPGNVRELKNVVDRALSLSRGGFVDLSKFLPSPGDEMVGLGRDEPAAAPTGAPTRVDDVVAAVHAALSREKRLSFKDAKNLLVEAFERRFLTDLVEESGGNISRAAQAAQMDRKHLRELMKKYGLWDGADE